MSFLFASNGFDHPSYSRQFVIGGIPIHSTEPNRAKNGQIPSNGPLEKTTPQSVISKTVEYGPPTCGRYKLEYKDIDSEIIAPYSDDKTIEFVARGDILLGCETGSAANRITNGQPCERVFHAVNAILRGEKIRFVAIATFAGQGNGMDDTRDNVGASICAGTYTIVNTGSQVCKVGNKAWVSEYPYMVQENDGKWVPGVLEIGHSPNQFRPAVYPLNHTNTSEFIATLRDKAEGLYRDFLESKVSVDTFDTKIRNVKVSLNLHWSMPLYKYGNLYLAFLILADVFNPSSSYELATYASQTVAEYFRDRYNNSKGFVRQYDMDMDNDLQNAVHTDESLALPSKYWQHYNEPAFQAWFRKMNRVVVQAMEDTIFEQQAFMDARVFCEILSTAAPGESMDIKII